jgi:hypothetical protein
VIWLRRPFREARLRSYIVRQHRLGRPLLDILEDPYVRRCGTESLWWRVLRDPCTMQALAQNDLEAIRLASAAFQQYRDHERAEG